MKHLLHRYRQSCTQTGSTKHDPMLYAGFVVMLVTFYLLVQFGGVS